MVSSDNLASLTVKPWGDVWERKLKHIVSSSVELETQEEALGDVDPSVTFNIQKHWIVCFYEHQPDAGVWVQQVEIQWSCLCHSNVF